MMYIISAIVPVMVMFIIIFASFRRIDVYSEFTSGVKNGLSTVVSVFPSLCALFISVSVFKASGFADYIASVISPVCKWLRFPTELVPFAVLRPVSGSGSLALASDLFNTYGPDSFVGRAASVMMGSTETTFYTVAVYFGSCGVKNVRHTLKCALMADLFSMILSIAVTYVWWYR